MWKFVQKIINNRKGMETIEFIIVIPMLIFLVFGSISYMLAIYAKIAVVDAAKEGARAAAIGVSTAEQKVREVLKGFNLKAENIESVTQKDDIEDNSKYISVKVVYNQPSLFPGVSKMLSVNNTGSYFRLSSTAVFKKESP